MSKAMVKSLYDEFSVEYEKIGFFHGDLTIDAKADVLHKWITGTYRLVFTTSGFGVGIHYDSVPLVIHYEGIWSLVDFVQESGRAGRNNKPAKSIVLLRNNWHPNYEKLPDADAQVIDDFVSPHGFCRRTRYTIGQYMDVVGFTCMTHVSNVQLCDICTATQAILSQSQFPEDQTQELKSLQLPEGLYQLLNGLSLMRRAHSRRILKLHLVVTRHANFDAPTILDNHGIALSTFTAFNEQLSFARAGICHGCGLNLRILNGLPEYVPGKACIYTAITRLVCYEIFMNGRLSVCIKDIDRGFLDTSDIKSFGKWLNIHPLGMLVNRVTAQIDDGYGA
ncbi:P-loop containing nucleoside triphosphate hydrolase protein [Lipomyces starkeyi]